MAEQDHEIDQFFAWVRANFVQLTWRFFRAVIYGLAAALLVGAQPYLAQGLGATRLAVIVLLLALPRRTTILAEILLVLLLAAVIVPPPAVKAIAGALFGQG